MTKDVQALLADLIRCPSVTPDNAGALEVLEAFLTPLGFVCKRLPFEGDGSYPVDNLFATRGTGGKHLLFAGHTDVVPPGDIDRWSHKPFDADIADGMMWGRGAVDMKSGVAAFCVAMAEAIANGSADNGTVSILVTNDEEADAVNGTDKVLKWAAAEGMKFDFAVVGEPSSAEKVVDRLKTGRRGSFSARIHVQGTQGHAAYPDMASNPVPVLTELATLLQSTPLDDGNAHFQPSNLEVTTIDVGNKAANVIPSHGQLGFNVRFNDIWNAASVKEWVHARIDDVDHKGCTVALEIFEPVSRSFVCPEGEAVALLDDVIAQKTGAVPEHSTTGGTSDARFIALYCPVVECGLVNKTMHATDERVPLAQLDELVGIYTDFIGRYLERTV